MKKSILFLCLCTFAALSSFSQIRMKLKYPKCEVVSQDVFAGIKKYKTIKIESAEEFGKYFKMAEGESINFEKNLVLAGFIGEGNETKFIEINAATYDPKAKYLYVRFDIKDEKLEDNGKFCVAVVPKSYSYKKVGFLKGKLYNMSQSAGD